MYVKHLLQFVMKTDTSIDEKDTTSAAHAGMKLRYAYIIYICVHHTCHVYSYPTMHLATRKQAMRSLLYVCIAMTSATIECGTAKDNSVSHMYTRVTRKDASYQHTTDTAMHSNVSRYKRNNPRSQLLRSIKKSHRSTRARTQAHTIINEHGLNGLCGEHDIVYILTALVQAENFSMLRDLHKRGLSLRYADHHGKSVSDAIFARQSRIEQALTSGIIDRCIRDHIPVTPNLLNAQQGVEPLVTFCTQHPDKARQMIIDDTVLHHLPKWLQKSPMPDIHKQIASSEL